MGRVVLVTGVAGQLGAETARRLVSDPSVERVVGVDVLAPRGDLAGVRLVRADIRNPVIAKVLAVEGVDTVAHLSVVSMPGRRGGRSAMKEANVIGTMQLLAACQRAPGVRRLVLKSSTAVYGSSPRDPAIFSEESPPTHPPVSGYAKDCAEVEGYVRGFARRRPDVAVTVLRCANILGARLDTPFAQYLQLPVVPTVLGFDPRLQLLHAEDALDVLHHAVVHDRPGTYNAAGDGVLSLLQLIRRLGRLALPVPAAGFGPVGQALGRTGRATFPRDYVDFLTYGRVVDTAAARAELGWWPRWSSARTLADFAAAVGLGPLTPDRLRRVERSVAAGLAGRGTVT